MNDLFWNSLDEDRVKGFCKKDSLYHCLVCGYTTEVGYVYPVGERYASAEKQMELHIEEEHGGMLEVLVSMDKKIQWLVRTSG